MIQNLSLQKSTTIKPIHFSHDSFTENRQTYALEKAMQNPKIKNHIELYVCKYLKDYPQVANSFCEHMNKVFQLPDEFAFKYLSDVYRGYGNMSKVCEKLNLIDGIRTDILSSVITATLKKHNITPTSIIDIGCGDGNLLKELQKNFNISPKMATGVEIFDDNSIQPFNRIKYNGKNLVSAIQNNYIYKNVPQEYSTAIIASVLHHNEDNKSLLIEANKIIKKGGTLLIEDVEPINGFDNFHTVMDNLLNIFRGTPESPIPANYVNKNIIVELAKQTGFEVMEHRTYNSPLELRQFVSILKKV